MSSYVEWAKLRDVVLVGIVIGAGLPALVAVAVRSLAGPGAVTPEGKRPAGRVLLAVASLTVVAAAIVTAIVIIATGGH